MGIDYIKKFKANCYCKFIDNSMFNYSDSGDIKTLFSYCKMGDKTAVISLEYYKSYMKYVLSYPMKNTKINYKVRFNTQQEAEDYIDYVMDQNAVA